MYVYDPPTKFCFIPWSSVCIPAQPIQFLLAPSENLFTFLHTPAGLY